MPDHFVAKGGLRLTLLLALSAVGPATAQTGTGWIGLLPATPPPARSQHGLAYDVARNRTVLFGGADSQTIFDDTWLWDGSNWTAAAPPLSPLPRYGHTMAYHAPQQLVVLFGGIAASNGVNLVDTWVFDGLLWLAAQPTTHPGPRRLARMALDPNSGNVLLFGGGVNVFAYPALADTWQWDGLNWTQLQPTTIPPARADHAMATDFARSTLVMFGGRSGLVPPTLTDTWIWNGSDWIDATPPSSPSPPAQAGHAMGYNAANRIVVLKGGGAFNGTTWAWDGAAWHADTRPAQPGGLGSAMAYDSVRDRNVMLAGLLSAAPYTWEYSPGIMGTWTPAGSGCAGTQGVPTLTPIGDTRPILGHAMFLELSYPVQSAVSLFALGFSDTQWSGGALPQDLTAVGMPGCHLHTSADVTVLTQLWGGTSTLHFHPPGTPSLVGIRVHIQGFVTDPGANAVGAVATNSGIALTGVF